MRIHRPIAEIIIATVADIFDSGVQADRVLEREFKANRKLGARDRRFIAEAVYDIVRWWRLLWTALGRDVTLESEDLWAVFATWLVSRGDELPAWTEFKGLSPAELLRALENAKTDPAARESVPDWLYKTGLEQIGMDWDSMLSELNKPAPVCLRANRLRTTREKLIERLDAEGIPCRPAEMTDDGVMLVERKNVFTSPAFKEGWFEVQDGASQQIAPLLAPQPGERVIDACAGAGGKTLHLGAMMKNKGRVISMDIHTKRLDELRRRCTRAGVDIVEIRTIEGSKTIKKLEASADGVLLDVPCTGLGVLRRNPDSKWKLSAERLAELERIQAEILRDYSRMVKKGGRLVYATCSILPSENERQVASFLASEHGAGWTLKTERKFKPGEHGYDGFYAALLVRG